MSGEVDRIARLGREVLNTAGANEPDWKPLEKALPMEQCGGFMFMGYSSEAIIGGGEAVRLYKHGVTRRYLNLRLVDGQVEAFAFTRDGRYMRCPLDTAIAHAFEGIEFMGATPETRYDDAYRAERDAALAEAGMAVVRVTPGPLG